MRAQRTGARRNAVRRNQVGALKMAGRGVREGYQLLMGIQGPAGARSLPVRVERVRWIGHEQGASESPFRKPRIGRAEVGWDSHARKMTPGTARSARRTYRTRAPGPRTWVVGVE